MYRVGKLKKGAQHRQSSWGRQGYDGKVSHINKTKLTMEAVGRELCSHFIFVLGLDVVVMSAIRLKIKTEGESTGFEKYTIQ